MSTEIDGGRVCIFCGAPADSKEHALPEWVQTIVPGDHEGVPGRRHVVTSDGNGIRLIDRGPGNLRPHDVPVRVVCRKCNTGWMSRLENRVKAVVVRMGHEGFTLSEAESNDLARWILKCAATWEWNYPPGVITPQIQRDAIRAGARPDGATTWVALRNPPSEAMDMAYSLGVVSTFVTHEGVYEKVPALVGVVQVGVLVAIGVMAPPSVEDDLLPILHEAVGRHASVVAPGLVLPDRANRLSEAEANVLLRDVVTAATGDDEHAVRELLGDNADWYFA